MPHTITTPRLTLRPLTARDDRAVHCLVDDPEYARMTGTWTWPVTRDEVRARIIAAPSQPFRLSPWFGGWDGPELVALLGLFQRDGGLPEIGYSVGAAFAGRGYATEAAGALRDFAFLTLQLPSLSGQVVLDNPASIRVLEKLGFVWVGMTSGWSAYYGEERPLYHYQQVNPRRQR